MTNGEKHIERLLSWYKEAVTEGGVCYLTCDDKNTLAYALKCCKHYEDIKKDIVTWMLREEPSSSGKPNLSEIPTGSITENDLAVNCIVDVLGSYTDLDVPYKREIAENILIKLSSVTTIRPKGRWFVDERPESDREIICSNCEQPIFKYHKMDFDYRPKYCPNCGAEMGEEE